MSVVPFAAILCLFAVTSVRSDEDGEGNTNPIQSLATYNTYLLDNFNRTARLPRIIAALRKEDADVYCLQEVWFETDMRQIVESLGGKYGHSWSQIHSHQGCLQRQPDEGPVAACDLTEVKALLGCVVVNCSTITDYVEYTKCVVTKCPYSSWVGFRCQEALVLQCAAAADVATCAIGLTNSSNEFTQTWLGTGHVPATQGLLMLSKKSMMNHKRGMYYDTGIFPRGYISAEVDGLGEVVCTHLTATTGSVYLDFGSGFTSEEEQNAFEFDVLMEKYNRDLTIMGDLNFSPSIPERGVVGEFLGQWQTLVDNGFVSMTERLEACTFCVGNEIFDARGKDATEQMMLDHILFKNDSSKPVSGISIIFNQRPSNSLSDHYGVKVLLDY